MAGFISERGKVAGGMLLAAAMCFGAGANAAPGKVTAVRFWSLGDMTRVAIEVSSDFRYKSDHLENPDRLFFDIQGATPAMVSKGMHVIRVNDALLKQIRIAETQPGVTRVVLDLEGKTQVTASQSANPNRLMIELRAKDKPAPPATTSVTGATTLSESPERTIEPDLVAALPSKAETPKMEAVKAQPKQFVAPPPAAPAPLPPVRTSLIEEPPDALVNRPVHPLPPYTPPPMLMAKADTNNAPRPAVTSTTAPAALAPAGSPEIATPAKRNSNGERSLTRVLGLKLGRVVIDPGHGGHDVGTHGPSGILEKDVVLDVAKRLGALLEERLNTEVIYTRSDDTYVGLEQRTQIANDQKADLFLSIHANSSPYRAVAGVETYYLNFTTSKAALDVAARENAGSQRSLFDLQDVLQKIALKDKIDESREFAARIESSLYGLSSKSNAGAKNRGVKKAPFVVLIGASMPSVLAEIGFLTNSGDEALLKKAEYRQKVAEALYKGIASYAETLSHFQVAERK